MNLRAAARDLAARGESKNIACSRKIFASCALQFTGADDFGLSKIRGTSRPKEREREQVCTSGSPCGGL